MGRSPVEARWGLVVAGLGFTQVLGWGSTYYLLTALARPIIAERGWTLAAVIGGLTIGLLVAALASPFMGRMVDRRGGRRVLTLGSVLLGLGLAGLALTDRLALYYLSWAVVGVGMSMALYDAAFAALGRLFGARATTAITALTLMGGLASTICWPLSVALVESVGWRAACLVYAGLHVLVALPIHGLLVPRLPAVGLALHDGPATDRPGHARPAPARRRRAVLALMAAVFTFQALLMGAMSTHVLTFLQAKGLGLEMAVAVAAANGPSQLVARAAQLFVGRFVHPLWTLVACVGLTGAGIASLAFGWAPIALSLVLYGAGIGLESIARGVLPLALFGAAGYARLIGWLALPAMAAEALSPLIAAHGLERLGTDTVLAVLAWVALAEIALMAAMVGAASRRASVGP